MSAAVIVDAIRSPMAKGKAAKDGRPGGALSSVHPVELLGQVLRALVERNGIDSATVDDVITGCVSQVGEQSGGIGRFAWLSAGLDENVPSVVINRACGSSQQAADFAAQGVIAGVYDIVIAAGVESMSRIPMFTSRIGQDPYGPAVSERYAPGLVPQGVSAELVAARWKLDREALDEYSARSHVRAGASEFSDEIVPISVPGPDGGTVVVEHDGRETGRAEARLRDRRVQRALPRHQMVDHGGKLIAVDRRSGGCADHEREKGSGARRAAASPVPLLRPGR